MIRNLKALGLAFFAIFAMGALAAASASATTTGQIIETTGSYPVHIHGADTVAPFDPGELEPALTSPDTGITIKCEETTYTGNITGAATSVTITPTYKKCNAGVGVPATVTMNECDYLFHSVSGTGHNWTALADLQCPPKKVVEIHRYSSSANHTGGTSNCTVTIGAQTNKGPVAITNETSPDALKLTGTIDEVAAQTHGVCSFGFTLNINTELHVNATVKGTEGKEIQIAKH